MLRSVIKKEILEHLCSFRFIVITAVSLLLVFTSILVMYSDYQSRMKDYEDLLPSQSQQTALVKPSQMSILVSGMDESISQQHSVNSIFINGTMSRQANALFKLFTTPDLFYIIKVILALCAILLSFNLVSGEKEARTLALSLSNSINRTKLLLGKWVSGMVVLLLPLIVAMLAVAVFFSINPDVQTGSQLWLKLALLLASSILYLAFFFTLGLLVSCFYTRSSSALVVSLFLWVLFVFIIPGLGGSAASSLVEVKSAQSRQIRQYLSIVKEYQQIQQAEGGSAQQPEYLEMKRQIADHRSKLNEQVSLSKAITRISPTAVYTLLATDFAGTGILERQKFKQTLFNHQITIEQAQQSGNSGAGGKSLSYQRLTVAEILAQAGLVNLLIIMLQNLAVFAGAYVLFLRYDVR
jgi:ABC-type transport system involved in multi-copper enzyme maturation permease subunit